jgi:hypothetical protein
MANTVCISTTARAAHLNLLPLLLLVPHLPQLLPRYRRQLPPLLLPLPQPAAALPPQLLLLRLSAQQVPAPAAIAAAQHQPMLQGLLVRCCCAASAQEPSHCRHLGASTSHCRCWCRTERAS